ncbi:MAG: CocE/NonD family hydrolase [Clostridiales bacterium]|nr:CocE/NonD family hydrolase [Clostridiales bacterium]
METFRQVREGMRIDFNVPIPTRDGTPVMANIYHPEEEGVYPVIFNYGIYGKDLHYMDGYTNWYERLKNHGPGFFTDTSGIHHCWEVLDPEKWCRWGYIIARIDSRGTGQTPGYMHPYCKKESEDIYDAIEWFAAQPWCNGKVGMSGTSYHAVHMWTASSYQPPHLAAMVAWEGHSDIYRDAFRHGGILSQFYNHWYTRQPVRVQYGRGDKGFKSRVTGQNVAGGSDLSEEELQANRSYYGTEIASPDNVLITDFHRQTMPDLTKIQAPFIAMVNWSGQGLHLRGSIEAYVKASSEHKHMYSLVGPHGDLYFADWGVNLQKKFFDNYLRGDNSGWKGMPKVQLRTVRPGQPMFTPIEDAPGRYRDEAEFPLARTQYTKFYLDCANYGISKEVPSAKGKLTYRGFSEGVTFLSQPAEEEFEFTGYIKGKVFVSSETTDADLFLTVRLFGPGMKETVLWGSNCQNVPITIGWQRASHRKQDPKLTTEERPFLTHDELWPLKPGEIVEMDVEVLPGTMIVPKGYRLGLTISGQDHRYTGWKKPAHQIPVVDDPERIDGIGPFIHNDPQDRPAEIFDCNVTLHFDDDKRPYLLLPVIPKK